MIEEREGGRRVVESVVIAAPIDRVFAALVRAEELAGWWTEPGVCDATEWSVDARIGGRWLSRWAWASGGTFSIGGTILELEAPHRLVYDWWDDRYPGMPRTVVTYDLVSTGSGTRLQVIHDGFDGSRRDLEDYAGGWWRVLEKITRHVTTHTQRP